MAAACAGPGIAATLQIRIYGRVPDGTVTPLDLLVRETRPGPAVTVPAAAPVDAVLEPVARHDVLAVAVVDGERRLVGAVAIDDVLAERLPAGRHGRLAAIRRRHAA